MVTTPPDFMLNTPLQPLEGIKPKLILENGSTPIVSDWKKGELYRNVGKHTHTKITKNEYAFRISMNLIEEIYLKKYGNLDLLRGGLSHTKEAKAIFDKIIRGHKHSEEEYFDYLVKFCRKLHSMPNDYDLIYRQLCFLIVKENPLVKHPFPQSDLLKIINEAEKQKYTPRPKMLVFNELYNLNFVAKTFLQNQAIKRANKEITLKLYYEGYTPQEIAQMGTCCLRSVKTYLGEEGISTKGQKALQKYKAVQACIKLNPKWTQKEIGEYVGLKERQVRTYSKIDKEKEVQLKTQKKALKNLKK